MRGRDADDRPPRGRARDLLGGGRRSGMEPRLLRRGPRARLAREGVDLPPAHAACLAMLEPVMTMDAGARIYAPGGSLLRSGDRLEQPGLVRALELLADEGAEAAYPGSFA